MAAATLWASAAHADWINLSGAMSADNVVEFHVNDDHVRLVLEVFVNDLPTFVDLIPQEVIKPGVPHPPLVERERRFAAETLRVVADGKTALPARIEIAEPRMRIERPNPYAGMINPTTLQPVPGPPADKRVLYAELIYPFAAGARPRTLTFIPPIDKKGYSAVAIGFIAYHRGVPVTDYSYLSEPAELNLDWQDPWYSRFSNRQYKRWQTSGVLTFLYVEPFEVRHETLIRIKDLSAWMDLDLRDGEFIEIDEFEPLKKRIGQFLLENSNVTIDGKSPRPILDRTNFVKRTMTRTYFLEQPERMPLNTAMIGVIVTYLTQEIPQEVRVKWNLFSDRVRKVPTSAIDPAGPFPSYVTPDDNVLVWKNYLKTYRMPTVTAVGVDEKLTHVKVPVISVICLLALIPLLFQAKRRRGDPRTILGLAVFAAVLITAGVLLQGALRVAVARPAAMTAQFSDKQARAILESLLKNVYRSFDFREEEDVYDRLATSVSGDLLSEIYLQNRRSLKVTQAGGAQARVNAVEIQSVDVGKLENEPLGRLFRTVWTAEGTVGHWGHIHTRKNRYDAEIAVKPVDGVWKIVGLTLLEEKRVDPYGGPSGGQTQAANNQ